jgi:hypothetical protein
MPQSRECLGCAVAVQIQEMAVRHKQSPLLSVGSLPEMTDYDCDCAWESSDDIVVGESDSNVPVNSFKCGNATAPGTGSTTPAADSGSAGDVAPGGSGELCTADGELGDVQSNETPAQCGVEGAWEPDVPAGDVGPQSTSASEWEIVSKMSTQDE